MYEVGQYVVYGSEGVCRIDEIGHPRLSGLDKTREYYRLTPHNRGGAIYAPVDGKIVMRPVISREELDALLPTLSTLAPLDDIPSDVKEAAAYYRTILTEHSCMRLLRLCKALYLKQAALSRSRRSINSTELRSWKAAEEMLHSEFGFVLGMPPSQVRSFLAERLQ